MAHIKTCAIKNCLLRMHVLSNNMALELIQGTVSAAGPQSLSFLGVKNIYRLYQVFREYIQKGSNARAVTTHVGAAIVHMSKGAETIRIAVPARIHHGAYIPAQFIVIEQGAMKFVSFLVASLELFEQLRKGGGQPIEMRRRLPPRRP